ncbi:MAG: TIGR00730 family Rossman fold protein [Ruminococcaceae bacterium]|nr:TIGR00730 family Rossman fold protein [Oscillospiraceae bacterium]
MNICVYGASSNEIDKSFIEKTEELGVAMAERGHGLVFGGGANGLMGAAARGVFSKKGEIIGIAPSFFNVDGILFEHCSEFLYPETMRERKRIMEEKSDAFVITPGGIGTFDEFFEIFTLKQLGRHKKPIAIFNINGYYDSLLKMLSEAVSKGFMNQKSLDLVPVFENAAEMLEYFEGYKQADGEPEIFKEIDTK